MGRVALTATNRVTHSPIPAGIEGPSKCSSFYTRVEVLMLCYLPLPTNMVTNPLVLQRGFINFGQTTETNERGVQGRPQLLHTKETHENRGGE